MSKSPHPLRSQLQLLAVCVAHNTLTDKHRKALAHALWQMAEGESFEEALGAKRPQGRPENDRALYGVYRVATLMLKPSGALYGDMGGEGLTKAAAFKRVAGELSISPDTLEKPYKSKRGQAVRKQVKEADQAVRKQVAQGGGG